MGTFVWEIYTLLVQSLDDCCISFPPCISRSTPCLAQQLYSFIENGPVHVHLLMFFNDLLSFFSHKFFQYLSGFAVWMLLSLNKIRESLWNNIFLIKNRETNSKGNRQLHFYFPFSLGFLISFFELFIPWCAGFKDHIIPNIQIFLHSLRYCKL